MKSLFTAVLFLVLASGAALAADFETDFAQEFTTDAGDVFLDRKHISIEADSATLVRTADSPKVVKVEMNVPMGERVCQELGYREVFGRDPSCGYDTYFENRWVSRCVAWGRGGGGRRGRGGRFGNSPGFGNGFGNRCIRYQSFLESFPVQTMRSCYYQVPDCVRYGVETTFKTRKVKLVFRRAAKLEGAEQEVFLLTAAQTRVGSNDADFKLKPIATKAAYEMKESDFFGDRIKAKKVGVNPGNTAQVSSGSTGNASVELSN